MNTANAIEPRAGVAYRPDIDGLRGLAVIAVVAFHAFPGAVRSGFVGVDVFFVVSGFLISGIVLDDLERGRFRFAHFYARRIRRLFPALLAVLAAATLGAAMFFLDNELRRFARHVAGAAAFVANFVFWDESGYFATSAQAKPLLHLWSLGIEEQFYLAWPLALWLSWRRPPLLLATVVVLWTASFLLNVHDVRAEPDKAFFLPAQRFWELLAGVFLAVAQRVEPLRALPDRIPEGARAAVTLAAIAAIAWVSFAIRDVRAFPGAWALIPVASTALVIACGPDTWVHRRLLGNRALVGVGLVSYALYLWHWPLLSFAHLTGHATPAINAALVAASALLAWITWRWLERPVRRSPRFPRAKVAVLASLMAVFAILGLLARAGIASTPRQLDLRDYSDDLEWTYDKTPRLRPVAFDAAAFPGAATLRADLAKHGRVMSFRWIDSGNPRKALFIGDSHVEHDWPRADQVILDNGPRARSAVFLTASALLPIPGVRIDPVTHPQFQGLARAMVDYALSDARIDTVVFGSLWPAHLAQSRSWPAALESPYYMVVDGRREHLHGGTRANELALAALGAAIRELRAAGKRVFVVQSEPGGNVRVLREWSGLRLYAPPVRAADFLGENGALRSRIAAVAAEAGAVVLDPYPTLCAGDTCPTLYDGVHPVYMDGAHFADRYARRHLRYLDDTLLGS